MQLCSDEQDDEQERAAAVPIHTDPMFRYHRFCVRTEQSGAFCKCWDSCFYKEEGILDGFRFSLMCLLEEVRVSISFHVQ